MTKKRTQERERERERERRVRYLVIQIVEDGVRHENAVQIANGPIIISGRPNRPLVYQIVIF